jgi:phd_YefM
MQQLTNLQELEMAVNLNGEVVVTKNDKNNVILMSMEEYKKSLIKDKIKNNLIKAEEDIKLGRVRDAEEVFKEWNAKYGI